jgi:tetratricopeptide (TPR) repeat protein
LESFNKVVEINQESHKGWNYRGEILIKLERDDEAIESCDRALQINPDFAPAYYNKAICYALQEQAQSAIENLQKAISLNPSYRDQAKNDPDFEAISESDRFWQVVGE